MQDISIRVDGPAKIALFIYDNNTFIVKSFLDDLSNIRIITNPEIAKLQDLISREELNISERLISRRFWGRQIGEDKMAFDIKIKPHSFRAFRMHGDN